MNTVVVTGGNNGIGLYMVRYLLKTGFKVGVIDLDSDNLEDLSEEFKENLFFSKCDLTDYTEIKSSIKFFAEKLKTIDILVNNACIAIFSNFEEKDIEDTKKEFEVNYFGTIRAIKEVLPYMRKQGYGIIHNVSSGVGLTGFPGIYGYASTKGSIEALTKCLALELKDTNITINIIHPPLTKTKSSSPLGVPSEVMQNPEIVGEKLAKKILSKKRVITPDFITKAGTYMSYKYPYQLGRLLSKMTKRAINEKRQ